MTVDIPDTNLEKQLERFCLNLINVQNHEKSQLISASISEAYKRLVKPSIKRKVRSSLTKTAESQGTYVGNFCIKCYGTGSTRAKCTF